jgi:hypothetical protein
VNREKLHYTVAGKTSVEQALPRPFSSAQGTLHSVAPRPSVPCQNDMRKWDELQGETSRSFARATTSDPLRCAAIHSSAHDVPVLKTILILQ